MPPPTAPPPSVDTPHGRITTAAGPRADAADAIVGSVGVDGDPAIDDLATFLVVPTTYDAMRMLALRAALLGFLKRWGVYCATAALVFSAGANAPFAIAAAVAAALMWPMRTAAASGWAIVPATAAYAIVGASIVAASRPLWWPRRWAVAERALPLTRSTLERSDRRFARLTAAPWQCALLVGVVGVVFGGNDEDRTTRGIVAGAWLLSVLGSSWLASRWMASVRRRSAAARRSPLRASLDRAPPASSDLGRSGPSAWRAADASSRASTAFSLSAARALVAIPIARGRAPRTAATLMIAAVAVAFAASVPAWSGLSLPWALALLAFASLASTSALRASTLRELQPAWAARRSWPIDRRACERARLALVLAPAASAVATALALAAVGADAIRAGALVAWCASVAVGSAIEAATSPTMPSQDRAARWVLLIATMIACGSEILRG